MGMTVKHIQGGVQNLFCYYHDAVRRGEFITFTLA